MKQSKIIADMTGREVVDTLLADSQVTRVWRLFSQGYAEIDEAGCQRHPPSPVEIRRMELQVANAICELFGVGLQ